MTTRVPSLWDVYHLENFKKMVPTPKNKWLVVTKSGVGHICGFFISSGLPAFVQMQQALHPCYAPIDVARHPFLLRDSLVACLEMHTATPSDYDSCVYSGRVHQDVAQAIVKAVSLCPRQKRKTQQYISSLALP